MSALATPIDPPAGPLLGNQGVGGLHDRAVAVGFLGAEGPIRSRPAEPSRMA